MNTPLLKKYEISNKPNDAKEWIYFYPKFDYDYDNDKAVQSELTKLTELNSRIDKVKELTDSYNLQIKELTKEKSLLLQSQIDMDFEEYNDKSLELTKKIEDLKIRITSNNLLTNEISSKVEEINESLLNAEYEVREKIYIQQLRDGKKEVIEFLQSLMLVQDKLKPVLSRMHNIYNIKDFGRGYQDELYRLIRTWNENTNNFDGSINTLMRKFEVNEDDYIKNTKVK